MLETVSIDLLKSQLCSKEEPTQQSSEESYDDFQITPKYRSSNSKEKMHKKKTSKKHTKKTSTYIDPSDSDAEEPKKCEFNAEHKATVLELLPEGYDYMFLNIHWINTTTCSFSHVNLKKNFVLRPRQENGLVTTMKRQKRPWYMHVAKDVQESMWLRSYS